MHSGDMQGFLIDLDNLVPQDPTLRDFEPTRFPIASGNFYPRGSTDSGNAKALIYRDDLRAFSNILQWAIRGCFWEVGMDPWYLSSQGTIRKYFGCPKKSIFLEQEASATLTNLYDSLSKFWGSAFFFSRKMRENSGYAYETLNGRVMYGSFMGVLRSCGIQPDIDLRLASKTPLPLAKVDELAPPTLTMHSISEIREEQRVLEIFIRILKGRSFYNCLTFISWLIAVLVPDYHSYHQQTGDTNGELNPYYTAFCHDTETNEDQGIFVDLDSLPRLENSPEDYTPNINPISVPFLAYDILRSKAPTYYHRHDLESLVLILDWFYSCCSRFWHFEEAIRDVSRDTVSNSHSRRLRCMKYIETPFNAGGSRIDVVFKVVADSYWAWQNDVYQDDDDKADFTTLGGFLTYEKILEALESCRDKEA
ncbi:hypothetical protein DFJ43DRAFT_1152632 [Lentinula guzmanii]|uniref:Fungal-type protein kinase domain-containing protein n=1 Tax=Lentinula guzmanii TaxID=2804957 RepID=A0AA38JCC1_9AGAR|nr:hypothetical protein DFJ43DRAFT_1152632 [Lentinula guzmanii]